MNIHRFEKYYFGILYSDTLTVTDHAKRIFLLATKPILWDKYTPINSLRVLTLQLTPQVVCDKYGLRNTPV